MKRIIAMIAGGLAVAVTAVGCGPGYGQSGTCTSNNFRISGNAWRNGVFVAHAELGGASGHGQDTGVQDDRSGWQYVGDVYSDSINTCGIPNDDGFLATIIQRNTGHFNWCEFNGDNLLTGDFEKPGFAGEACLWTINGAIIEADATVYFKGADTNGDSQNTSLEANRVALHEFGHAVGLCHNGACLPTSGYISDGNNMGDTTRAGEQLGRGDLSGLHLTYSGHTH
jgi:hypothetical protein